MFILLKTGKEFGYTAIEVSIPTEIAVSSKKYENSKENTKLTKNI